MFLHYLIVCLVVIFSPLLVVSMFYGIGYSLLERFVEPVFDFRRKRILELAAGFFIVSMILAMYLEIITGHFHIQTSGLSGETKLLIPCLFLVVIRCIVKFHSSRIARDHLNVVMFIVIVSSAASLAIFINNVASGNGKNLPINLPDSSFFINLFLLSAFIPFITDVVLICAKKNYFVKRYIIKDKKLIDLTEELPITFEFISGEDTIKNRIKMLVDEHKNRRLSIMTKSYGTVINNIEGMVKRCTEGGVRIIGPSANDNTEISMRIVEIEKRGLLVCEEYFDDIRVVMDGDHRLIASFATSGNRGSHVGVYTEHPFIISLFRSYFETKCRKKGLCSTECTEVDNELRKVCS